MVAVTALEELRSFIMASGEQCVMTPGTWMILLWCADSYSVDQSSVHLMEPPLVQAMDRSGWMMFNVQEVKETSHNVHTED